MARSLLTRNLSIINKDLVGLSYKKLKNKQNNFEI